MTDIYKEHVPFPDLQSIKKSGKTCDFNVEFWITLLLES